MNLLETVAFVVLINGFLIEILILHILFKMVPFHLQVLAIWQS